MFNIKPLPQSVAVNLNPQSLAFVGDAVFSLYIRQKIVVADNLKPNLEHKLTTKYVKASGQSTIFASIEKILNEEELRIYKRARNYKTNNVAKNSKVIDYKRATGFEALLGYLYLTENLERLENIMQLGYDCITNSLDKGEDNA